MPTSKIKGIPDFEGLLTITGEAYEAQGRAMFRKIDPPMIFHGRFASPKKDNPWLDFGGVWSEHGGRALFFEAKETRDDVARLGIGCEGGGMTPRQMEMLEAWARMGAAAFVLWLHRGEIRMATYEVLAAARLDRATLAWRDAMKIPPGTGLVAYDFLTAAKFLFP